RRIASNSLSVCVWLTNSNPSRFLVLVPFSRSRFLVPKQIPETDAIFENLKAVPTQAASEDNTLRISLDTLIAPNGHRCHEPCIYARIFSDQRLPSCRSTAVIALGGSQFVIHCIVAIKLA
ncbi:MAG: hypothetical protein WD049_02430, partial [Candidatus Paceibacterota bacterium]